MAKKPIKRTGPRVVRSKAATKKTPPPAASKDTKQDKVLAMLRRPSGASVTEIVEATEWQAHSVRGFLSGALKKRLEIDVISEKGQDGVRRYYVAPLKA